MLLSLFYFSERMCVCGVSCNENLHISYQLSTLTNFNYHSLVAVHTREGNQGGTLG